MGWGKGAQKARVTHLALDEMPDARLGHDRDGHSGLDFPDQGRVRHARDAALSADVGGHALERHDGAGAGLFGDAGLTS